VLLHMEHKANKTYSLSSISATIIVKFQIVVDLWVRRIDTHAKSIIMIAEDSATLIFGLQNFER
jgi:hypothetical protein